MGIDVIQDQIQQVQWMIRLGSRLTHVKLYIIDSLEKQCQECDS